MGVSDGVGGTVGVSDGEVMGVSDGVGGTVGVSDGEVMGVSLGVSDGEIKGVSLGVSDGEIKGVSVDVSVTLGGGVSIEVELGVTVSDLTVGDAVGAACEGMLLQATNITQHSIMKMKRAMILDCLDGILSSFIDG